jgi:hypothetical protein
MMKSNKAEDEIFSRIKQSLDSHKEDYIPGAWENFLSIQKKRKRKIFLRIVSGIAACLILGFLGSSLFFFEKSNTLKIADEQIATAPGSIPDTNPVAKETGTEPIQAPSKESKLLMASNLHSNLESNKRENLATEERSTTSNFASATPATKDSAGKIAAFPTTNDRQQKENQKDTSKSVADTVGTKKPTQFLPALQAEEGKAIAVVSQRKVRIGINFSPGINSTQSAKSFNFQGGVSADIDLSSKFQLSTGLLLENQNIVNKVQGIVTSSSGPANQTRSKLLNLDVPVNLKWKFLTEKSNSYYVSAGLSSLVRLSQNNKNTVYSQLLIPVSSIVADEVIKSYSIVNQVSVTQNNVAPERNIDFAGRFNLIFGVERKLSDKIYIHLEPYAKIPVSGLSAETFKYTSTGINFKISF